MTIRLPLDLPRAPAPEGVKVLLVDDDPDFLEQHRVMLEGNGFTVVTAERSEEALEVAGREIPDAFVLDLMMERNDSGARLARTLRRDPRFRRAPMVMLTSVVRDMGFEFERNPREVLEWMKADAWFDKPAPVQELAETLRRLLSGAQEPGGAGLEACASPEEPEEGAG
jgi:CheY-like chemotaxis protein